MSGAKRSRDSCTLQLVFFWEKASVAAMKMETSWVWPAGILEVGEGWLLVLGAGLESREGGGEG